MTVHQKKGDGARRIIVSAVCADGRIIELVYDRERKLTRFSVFDGDTASIVDDIDDEHGMAVPIPATNNLIKHEVVTLPDDVGSYGTARSLINDIQAYLYRYVDLSEPFSHLACWYVLLTWVYDAFNEVPYLRLRGDVGRIP